MVQEVCSFATLFQTKMLFDTYQDKLKITFNNFIYKEKLAVYKED